MDHISAAAKYLARCRVAGDKRSIGLLLRDLLSEDDAASLDAALHEINIGEGGAT